MNAISRYAQAQNETASKERMMVLFEGALRFMRVGAAALEEGRGGQAAAPLTRANDIVLYLHSTFDMQRAPRLGELLGQVYRFVCLRLISASLKRDPRLAREAEKVFAPVANAFAVAVQKVQAERAAEAR